MAPEDGILTDELRSNAIGIKGEPLSMDIEKGHVRRFAEALGDNNPLFTNEKEARKSRYGGLIAPPTFLRAIRVERPPLPFSVPYGRNLDGGSEWEFFEPVRIGDYITAQIEIDDIFERPGRLGTMLFTIYLTTYTNQLNEVVATQRGTSIRY